MQSQEKTEAEPQVLREGLRILARLIARHHLAAAAAREQQTDQAQPPQHSGAAKP